MRCSERALSDLPRFLSLLLTFPFLGFSSFAAGISLSTAGKPSATIVIGGKAGELTKLAASEMESYLEKLTGSRLPQIVDNQVASLPLSEPILVIGTSGQNTVLGDIANDGLANTADLKPEGFVVKTLTWRGRPVVLVAGADEAGTLYGSYELLERLGISFRLTADIIPERKSDFSTPELDLKMEPSLKRRGFLFSANFDNASTFSYEDYEHFLDQMARMKCNYLQFWWFAYAPWLKFSYRGETKLLGDVAAKESGYHSWTYGGFGSRTIEDVSIGREHFKDRPRLAPLEMQQVNNPEQAFEICRDMLRRIIAHAAKRNIKVWLAVELASLPPNLARFGENVADTPFHSLFGTFLHPLDPVNREIQVSRLKALVETYPQAEGIFLNFAELYPDLATEKYRAFFEKERPRFHDLRPLSVPWAAALANIYDVKWDRLIDSNIGYLDLFSYMLKQRDEVAPGVKLGLMTVGRGYALPLFHKMLPPDVPFSSLESSGVWTMMGMPMEYFRGMGDRERIIQPRVDDDFDMLGMQFSVRQYAEKDRIFSDGVKHGLSGVAGQLDRARGTEFNSSFLAQAAWAPGLTTEQFYRSSAEKMFGKEAAEDMFQAFMKLEEHQAYLGYYEYDGGYGVLLCCSGIREVNAAFQYARQKNPFAGPIAGSWKRLISATPDFKAQREGSVRLLNEALSCMQRASAKVAPQGRYELNYLINRTETFRDVFLGLNHFREGLVTFDEAFRGKDKTEHAAFLAQLDGSLATLHEATNQLKEATRKYSQIIDHVSDLAVLYHLNARVLLGTDLSVQLLENVVNFHRGKQYLPSVPFDRLYPRRPDEGIGN